MRDAQVLEGGLVGVALLDQVHGDLVDHALEAGLLDVAADGTGLGALHVVLGENVTHALDARLDLLLVVGRAVLAEKVLQHVARHGRVAAHELHEVLAHHVAGEYVIELRVEAIHMRHLAIVSRALSANSTSHLDL